MTIKRLVFITYEMVRRYFSDEVSQTSAELAYFLLFSIFPLLMFLNSVLSFINIPPAVIEMLLAVLPPEIRDLILGYVTYITGTNSISPLIFGVFFTIYFFSRAINSVIRAIFNVYGVKKTPKGWKMRTLAVLFTIGFMAAIFLSFLLIILGQQLLLLFSRFVDIPLVYAQIWNLGRYVLGGGFLFLFLLSLYALVPARKNRIKTALPGTVFSFVAWVGFSVGFSYYVTNMSRYSVLYGSLGAIMLLMLWLYLTGSILIMGAQLNVVWRLKVAYGPKHFTD